ncbi:transposase [Tunturiibacter gelidiferens]|uniref:transposase n=1 Tax=Tunturiibacter gelidiferens TaxID=3069689 RepID=UPI003D9B9179
MPRGKELKYRGIKPAANRSHIYRSTEAQCRGCSKKAECTSGRYKQLVIHVDEEVRQRARLRNQEQDFFRHQRSRKKIEALFGELKNRICLRRVRLRRLKYVREQFLMAATAQNLKRLVRFLALMPPDQGTKNQLRINSALKSHRSLEQCRIGTALRLRRRVFQQLRVMWIHNWKSGARLSMAASLG